MSALQLYSVGVRHVETGEWEDINVEAASEEEAAEKAKSEVRSSMLYDFGPMDPLECDVDAV